MGVHAPQKNAQYSLTVCEAAALRKILAEPADIRQTMLMHIGVTEGLPALVKMFAEFMGLVNAVETNARNFHELMFITEGKMWPQEAEKVNMPTIVGALHGVAVAIEPVKGMCGGCAYRLGTSANQSECTTADAVYVVENGGNFMCHMDLDENDEYTHICAGFVKVRELMDANGEAA